MRPTERPVLDTIHKVLLYVQGTPPATGGPGGGWQPSNYVEYSSNQDLYIVNRTLIDALNDDASILNNDATYVEELSAGGFEFNNVVTGTLAYELGLQDGDIPQSVNSHDVTTLEGAIAALEALRDETSLTVMIRRGSNTITLNYSIQ